MPGLRLTSVRALAMVVVVIALAGCQVRVAVDTHVERDGTGVLTVGIGLDDKALSRIGDLDQQVRVGDLTAAGWEVGRAERSSDGLTWLRATKRFGSIDELNRALAELTGEPAMVRDFRLTEEDAATAVVHRLTGTVDATRGMAAFTDAQLGARLGGDPVAARVAGIEMEEGKKVADMVTIDVTAALGGEGQVRRARLDDRAPLNVEVVARDAKPPTSVGGGAPLGTMALAGVLVVAMLAAVRQRFRRSSR
jgi:MYXO-CTERM domain-containing protein